MWLCVRGGPAMRQARMTGPSHFGPTPNPRVVVGCERAIPGGSPISSQYCQICYNSSSIDTLCDAVSSQAIAAPIVAHSPCWLLQCEGTCGDWAVGNPADSFVKEMRR